jgi:cytochrome P450
MQPKPPHDFLWGHLKVMGEIASTFPPNTHPQAYYTAIARKYNLKGIFYIDLWPIAPSSVVLSDPELLDQVTVVHPLRISKFADDFLAPMIGHNVIAAVNGPIWKKLHNSMAPAFSWSHIKNLTGVMVEETMHFRNALDGLAKTGEVFSMEETSMKLIFDVITRIVFSFSLNAQTEGSSYLDDLREMIHLAENQLSFNPFVHLMTFFKKRKVLGRLHPSILTKIRERFALLRSENVVPSRKDPASILDLMLREDLGAGKSGDGNDGLSPEYLDLLLTKCVFLPSSKRRQRSNMFNYSIKGLLVGGHGTTTDSLCVSV